MGYDQFVGFELLLAAAAVAGGATAAVTGFGIGSLITPVLALTVETKLAVAAVSVPHLVGTAFRFWTLGGRPDRAVLWSFGLTSAAGGLTGALLHGWASNALLALVFGILLVFVALSELTGLAGRLHFGGRSAWAAGAISGLLGGMVGNQGGVRSAALLRFELEKRSFVATATAIGLMVDVARMPVYAWTSADRLSPIAGWIALATAGVLAGTLLGTRLLTQIPRRAFRPIVATIIGTLGFLMILRAL
ncbi:MAG TPA: sulfite exporter TauE/SafE family protein [Vicinamibacterales bacterium]|nr:sulfite exporter TauE/SafE family protein [Vicinamibacterales bacterium]